MGLLKNVWAFWSLQKGQADLQRPQPSQRFLQFCLYSITKGFCNFVCTASQMVFVPFPSPLNILNLGGFLASGIEIWWYLTNLGVGHRGQTWYIPRYGLVTENVGLIFPMIASHLVGIMISKTIGKMGYTIFRQTHIQSISQYFFHLQTS